MKNIYTIIGIVGIIIVSIGAYLIGNHQSNGSISTIFQSQKDLLTYIPGELGQVLVLQADEDLKAVAQATNSFDSETFGAVFDTLETIVVYQNTNPQMPVNLLFLEGNEAFDITQIEALGLLAEGEDYEARKLGDRQVVYADTAALDRYEQIDTRITDSDAAEDFLDALEDKTYNAGFFSTPEGITQLGGYSQLLASNLESTYLLSSLRTDTPSGKLIVQMKDDTIPESTGRFDPTLAGYYNDALFYLEVQAIQDFLGIDESQIQTFLPFIAGSAGIPLPSPDGITNLLAENLALVVTPSQASPLGLQASLVVSGEEHFETLSAIYPLLEQIVGENLPLLGTGGVLETDTMENALITTYSLTPGGLTNEERPVGESLLPVLSLQSNNETTQLNLFGMSLVSSLADNGYAPFEDDDDTVAVFGRDSSLLGQLLGGIVPGGVQSGTLSGKISADDDTDQIVIAFSQNTTEE